MSFSALDFLTDVQNRLTTRLPSAPNLPVVDFLRVVNFVEKRFVVRVVLGDDKIGEIQCREVEESQDSYIRGAFVPSDPEDSKTTFTVRRDKTYESETEYLTGALLMRCFTAMPASAGSLPPPPPPPPAEPEEPKSYVIPGENFDPSALFGDVEEEKEEPAPEESEPTGEAALQADSETLYDDSGQVVSEPQSEPQSEPKIPDQPFDPATLFGKNPEGDGGATPSGLPPPPFDPAALFGGGASEPPSEEKADAGNGQKTEPPEPEIPAQPFDPAALFGKNPAGDSAGATPSGLPPPPFDPAALFGAASDEAAESDPADAEEETGASAETPEDAEAEKFPPPPFDPAALFGNAPAGTSEEDSSAAAEEKPPPAKAKAKKKSKSEDEE